MGLSELLATYGRNYWEALLSTWGMTALCFALVMLVAIAVTVMRVSPFKPLRVLGDGYVQVFRNIPGVSLLIIIVYALPSLNLVLPYRTCVILTVVTRRLRLRLRELHERHQHHRRWSDRGRPLAGPLLREDAPPDRRSPGAAHHRPPHDQPAHRRAAHHLPRFAGPARPAGAHGRGVHINTRSTGGILAFGIAAAGYALTAVAIAFVGNRIDKKVRIVR